MDDLQGCGAMFKPTGTIITMYTFADLGSMHNDDGSIKDNTVLKIEGSTAPPRSFTDRSRPVYDPFIDKRTRFHYDETYYVSAMYVMEREAADGDLEDSQNFSLPNTSRNPLFIPAYQVNYKG